MCLHRNSGDLDSRRKMNGQKVWAPEMSTGGGRDCRCSRNMVEKSWHTHDISMALEGRDSLDRAEKHGQCCIWVPERQNLGELLPKHKMAQRDKMENQDSDS